MAKRDENTVNRVVDFKPSNEGREGLSTCLGIYPLINEGGTAMVFKLRCIINYIRRHSLNMKMNQLQKCKIFAPLISQLRKKIASYEKNDTAVSSRGENICCRRKYNCKQSEVVMLGL